jgi:hypothetical protein
VAQQVLPKKALSRPLLVLYQYTGYLVSYGDIGAGDNSCWVGAGQLLMGPGHVAGPAQQLRQLTVDILRTTAVQTAAAAAPSSTQLVRLNAGHGHEAEVGAIFDAVVQAVGGSSSSHLVLLAMECDQLSGPSDVISTTWARVC